MQTIKELINRIKTMPPEPATPEQLSETATTLEDLARQEREQIRLEREQDAAELEKLANENAAKAALLRESKAEREKKAAEKARLSKVKSVATAHRGELSLALEKVASAKKAQADVIDNLNASVQQVTAEIDNYKMIYRAAWKALGDAGAKEKEIEDMLSDLSMPSPNTAVLYEVNDYPAFSNNLRSLSNTKDYGFSPGTIGRFEQVIVIFQRIGRK